MRVGLAQVFPIAALVLLAGASIWLERATRGPEDARAPTAQRGPDVVVEQMAVTRFDINGNPHYYLDARQLEHLPGEAHARLSAPVLNLLKDDGLFRLAADTAIARDDGERIDLAGEVRGERRLPGSAPLHFASDSLTIWPNVESAKSIDPVTITQDGATARGDHMMADNLFGLITLTGQVRSHMPIQRK
jgi:lipopolysaccharide export system protein LptC